MKPRLVLLLTRDSQFKKLLSDVLLDGAVIIVKHNVSSALQTVCSRGSELDLAVIDFDDSCHGMTLLNAIRNCRRNLPIVAVTSSDAYHAASVAYANGVEACLTKPFTASDLRMVVAKLGAPKPLLVAA